MNCSFKCFVTAVTIPDAVQYESVNSRSTNCFTKSEFTMTRQIIYLLVKPRAKQGNYTLTHSACTDSFTMTHKYTERRAWCAVWIYKRHYIIQRRTLPSTDLISNLRQVCVIVICLQDLTCQNRNFSSCITMPLCGQVTGERRNTEHCRLQQIIKTGRKGETGCYRHSKNPEQILQQLHL